MWQGELLECRDVSLRVEVWQGYFNQPASARNDSSFPKAETKKITPRRGLHLFLSPRDCLGRVDLSLLYCWVGCAVFMRRLYIFNIAVACSGVSLVNFPLGTILGVVLLLDLYSSKNEFK
jgi:hypothetical protein